jgi:peptide/nickel transport system substrate-binding protein
MIIQFDLAKPESANYDEAQVPSFESFMSSFKGWKIVSEAPLVIEYYTDAYGLDAENNVTNARAAYPSAYGQGQAAWHNLVPGLMADANAEAAFSPDKAEVNGVEWLSYIAGPSLDIMASKLVSATEETYIPFAPTLGNYITADEAAQRYANLAEFYRRYGHFYIGTGPFYLQRAFPVEGNIILQHYDAYPDPADKWNQFQSAPIPEVAVDGPDRVTIGEEATFDIFVDLAGEPYAADEIDMVKYLVFDAVGNLVEVGEGTLVEDGYYQATLGADLTGGLEAGSNQFAAIVVSKRALIPVTETWQFVTQ